MTLLKSIALMQKNNRHLIVFVKAPIPGQCKTRLTPYLSSEQASEFYKKLVHTCFENMTPITHIDISIYSAPDIEHSFIKQISKQYSKSLYCQQGEDLGERMHHALSYSLKTYEKSILIGTDCPLLNAEYIDEAFEQLNHADMVFGPAEDGGYVLIGAKKIKPILFKNIQWSGSNVLEQSLLNNQAENIKTHLLKTLWDIDTPDDYIRYQKYQQHKNLKQV